MIINSTGEKMCNHLQFFGYNIEMGENDCTFARHSQKNNLMFFPISSNVIVFRSSFNISKKKIQDLEYYRYLNEANGRMLSKGRYVFNGDEMSLLLDSYYIGEYNKELFGEFLNILDQDFQRFRNGEKFSELFI